MRGFNRNLYHKGFHIEDSTLSNNFKSFLSNLSMIKTGELKEFIGFDKENNNQIVIKHKLLGDQFNRIANEAFQKIQRTGEPIYTVGILLGLSKLGESSGKRLTQQNETTLEKLRENYTKDIPIQYFPSFASALFHLMPKTSTLQSWIANGITQRTAQLDLFSINEAYRLLAEMKMVNVSIIKRLSILCAESLQPHVCQDQIEFCVKMNLPQLIPQLLNTFKNKICLFNIPALLHIGLNLIQLQKYDLVSSCIEAEMLQKLQMMTKEESLTALKLLIRQSDNLNRNLAIDLVEKLIPEEKFFLTDRIPEIRHLYVAASICYFNISSKY